MSCNNAAIRAVFDSATLQDVAAGGTINLPEVTSNSCCATANGGTVTIKESGNYDVTWNVTTVATAAGVEEIQLYRNGSPVPGSHALGTAAAIGDYVPMSASTLVSVDCCCGDTLSLRTVGATTIRVANLIVEE